ncbi:MAG: dienelactone hydrolase family protein [Gemmatimonadaceae bacterium]|nr:dienelactone hydrolase family protein [Chitinophagaceae bacterium]
MKSIAIALISAFILASCGEQKPAETTETTVTPAPMAIIEQTVTYTSDTTNLIGFVAYDSSDTVKRPVILVVPEWWGVNDYTKSRVRQLAELGYFAIAVDVYGNGKIAANPQEAMALAGPFYQNPKLAQSRLNAALAKALTYAQADSSKTAAIGYCFGGSMVLNAAKLGSNLGGVVSFHGGLEGVQPDKKLLRAKVLVCHGNADSFVPEAQVSGFKKQMDSINADYKIIRYDSATHAFTNPAADETAKKFSMPIAYNAAADKKSWEDMKVFLESVFRR